MRFLLAVMCALTLSANAATSLSSLQKNQEVSGFKVAAIYVDANDRPFGARFVHRRSGFTLDLLQIESVPQGYTWVNSIPVSDQGEPHTQEHLLLGKGTTGRAFAGLDTIWLAGSNAFTQQWRTSYHFNTSAGADVFFDLFGAQLNALLHPNYTDEEIRREVRNFGVTENPDKSLRLEEKGSVYNEMVSSSTNRYSVLFRGADHLVYGAHHPLAYNSGGEPSGIRTMKPEDIRNFHAANYYLANMGTIAAFPKSVAIDDILKRTDAILRKVESEPKTRETTTAKPLPKPEAAPAGTIEIVEYPFKNDQQPSPVSIVWPATRNLSANETLLLELFFDNIASDPTTNLYKMFVDSKTKVMDLGATAVFSNVSRDQGQPAGVIIDNAAPANLSSRETLAQVRERVTNEIARIAALPDGSAELKAFNDRLGSRVVELQRQLAKFVNTPPSFGFRNARSDWMDQLLLLEKTSDFRKSVTLKPQLDWIEKQIASDKNVWRDLLPKWQITGVTPYVVAAKPSPALLQRDEQERVARAQAEADRLAKQYNVTDAQEAIKRYRADYDAESARIEEEAKKITPPSFVKSPPMTLDEPLQFAAKKTANGIPLVASTFENMTSSTTGLALRADVVTKDQLRYLALLPQLMTRVGVIENGKPVSYEQMSERLKREILGLDALFLSNPRTNRIELLVRGSGIGADESQRALDWMQLVLQHPDWRVENLPRIRDVVDQAVGSLRNTMQQQEEQWVENPATAYRMQASPAFVAGTSLLTRGHSALRLRWLLKDAPDADRDALTKFFNDLATATATRAELKKVTSAAPPSTLSPAGQTLAKEALRDLDLTLNEVPDSSLATDWTYLVNAIRDDLMTPPATVLANLDATRRALLRTTTARMYIVSNTTLQQTLQPKIDALASSLDSSVAAAATAAGPRFIDDRLLARDPSATSPVYVGLIAPNMKGGVITTSVPGITYADFDDKDKQLDYLASRLHAGYGAHGIFLKTIGAGLAYSNGLRASVSGGRMGYYAERTPELPQTVRFVVNELKNAPRDTSLADYTIAQVFGESRAAATYENRAESMASDLADGQTPENVRKFRTSILELRKDPNLGATLWERKDNVYGRVLPGYNVKGKDVPGAVYFTIGPDKQQDAWEQYLKSAEGPETKLFRLYPRDYWMP